MTWISLKAFYNLILLMTIDTSLVQVDVFNELRNSLNRISEKSVEDEQFDFQTEETIETFNQSGKLLHRQGTAFDGIAYGKFQLFQSKAFSFNGPDLAMKELDEEELVIRNPSYTAYLASRNGTYALNRVFDIIDHQDTAFDFYRVPVGKLIESDSNLSATVVSETANEVVIEVETSDPTASSCLWRGIKIQKAIVNFRRFDRSWVPETLKFWLHPGTSEGPELLSSTFNWEIDNHIVRLVSQTIEEFYGPESSVKRVVETTRRTLTPSEKEFNFKKCYLSAYGLPEPKSEKSGINYIYLVVLLMVLIFVGFLASSFLKRS